jgi:hypothetical protein
MMRPLTAALILLLAAAPAARAGHNEGNRPFTAATTARSAVGASPASVNPGDRPGGPHYLPGNYAVGGALTLGGLLKVSGNIETTGFIGSTGGSCTSGYYGFAESPEGSGGVVLCGSATALGYFANSGTVGILWTNIAAAINSDDILSMATNGTTGESFVSSATFKNISANGAAGIATYWANNASNTEASCILNSSANTGGNGDNSFTCNGGAGLWLQGGGTNGIEVGSGGAVSLLNQGTSGTIADAVCVTSSGQIVLDASSTVCGLSDERLKNFRPFRSAKGFADACAELDAVRTIEFTWKPGTARAKSDKGLHAGFGAWGVAFVDERLVARDVSGNPRAWRYDGMMALAVACEQQERAQLARLESEIAALKR